MGRGLARPVIEGGAARIGLWGEILTAAFSPVPAHGHFNLGRQPRVFISAGARARAGLGAFSLRSFWLTAGSLPGLLVQSLPVLTLLAKKNINR